MMQGVVVKFDTGRGFGFIRPDNGGENVFVHISNVQGRQALRPGQQVAFEVEQSEKGPRAIRVVPGRVPLSPYVLYGSLSILFCLLVAGGINTWLGVGWLVSGFVAVNLCAILLYGYDKLAARGDSPRVPELILLGVAVPLGTPGSWMSQQLFRHKTRKMPFLAYFYSIVGIQLLVIIGWFLWPDR